jgi:hypothetical protein
MSYASEQGVLNAQMNTAIMQQLPSVLYRPRLMADGDKWCALYGENLMDGVAGFGNTPAEAMSAFDAAWTSERPPGAK